MDFLVKVKPVPQKYPQHWQTQLTLIRSLLIEKCAIEEDDEIGCALDSLIVDMIDVNLMPHLDGKTDALWEVD